MNLDAYADLNWLARGFESLGDNCELGMLQRDWGVDYSNLFRWAFSNSLPDLIALLHRRFAGLYQFENLVPFGGGEMVEDRANGIAFNSDMKSAFDGRSWHFLAKPYQRLEVYSGELQKITHLLLATKRSLAEARKVWVYKQNSGTSDIAAGQLHDALRQFGPVRLLVVNLADAANPAGSARLLREGLILGYLDRFAPPENADQASAQCWIDLLRNAANLAGLPAASPADSLCSLIERGMDDPALLPAVMPADFPLGNYRRLNPDLAQLGWDDAQLFRSYSTNGYFEGRIWQGGENEPACQPGVLDILDHLYRLNLHAKALSVLTDRLDELAGSYRAFAIALRLGAPPVVLLACYQAIRQRPGFVSFGARCASLLGEFFTQVPHADFADYAAARQATDGWVGWDPEVMQATVARHITEMPTLAPRLSGLLPA